MMSARITTWSELNLVLKWKTRPNLCICFFGNGTFYCLLLYTITGVHTGCWSWIAENIRLKPVQLWAGSQMF